MEELISVIVPVYNVENFLEECLISIINQSYRNLEIIIINDGSTDSSKDICEKYKKKDKRIKVIHQDNAGLSVARNTGIDNSLGKFLTFVDSDDYIHEKMIEILYNNMKKYNADISFCDYAKNENEIETLPIDSAVLMSPIDMYNGLYDKHIKIISACLKLYKREIFDYIRYPKGKIYEDAFVIHKILDKSKVFVYSDNKLYFYRTRKGSIMNSKYSLKQLDYLEVLLERMAFMKERGYDYFYAREFYRYVKELKVNYKKIKKYFPKETEKLKQLIKEFNKYYNKNTRKLIIKKRIRFTLDMFWIKALFIEKYFYK